MQKYALTIIISAIITLLLSACSEKTDIENSVTITDSKEYVYLSDGAEFYDYIYISGVNGNEISGTLTEKAINAATSSKYYMPDNENGNPIKINSAYTDDFDSDGKEETFILVDIPMEFGAGSVLVFSDANENITVLDAYADLKPVAMLDFGDFKQIIFGGNGYFEADDHSAIFGVIDGTAVPLDRAVGFVKSNCFLVSYSQTGAYEMEYYDTAAKEYRVIPNTEISKDDVLYLTTDSEITEKINSAEHLYIIGNYYYIFEYGHDNKIIDYDAFIYKNGSFAEPEELVAISYYDEFKTNVKDLDISYLLKNMQNVLKTEE